jgi:hypothetical protein
VHKYLRGESNAANVYIEPGPKGRPEGSQIDDYVVEDHADHALASFKKNEKRLVGRKTTATLLTSLASGT